MSQMARSLWPWAITSSPWMWRRKDGETTKIYTITVTRAEPPSTDATLSTLTLSEVHFGTFVSGTTAYTASVANSVSRTKVTPSVNHSGASYVIKLGGVTDADGTVSLAVGNNVITIEVTAEDGDTTQIYTVRITRDNVSDGICDRTSEVQSAILAKLNEGLDAPEITDCSEVTDDDLGAITGSMTLSNMQISALKSGDFQGLSNLESLYLDHNNLSSLPEGVFRGLESLDILWLHFNPGSPFSMTMELEQQGKDSVLARVVEGTPFDHDGSRYRPTAERLSSTEITVVGGDVKSEAVVVTADEGSTEVTVSVASSDIPGTGYTNYFGLVWQEANPLAITFDDDALLDRYDTNNNDQIDKGEVIEAIDDYLFGVGDDQLTKAQVTRDHKPLPLRIEI